MAYSKRKTLIALLACTIIAIGILGLVTMQLLPAAIGIVLLVALALISGLISGRMGVREDYYLAYPKQTAILILLAAIIIIIGIIGIATMQLLAAAVVIVLIAVCALLVKFLSGRTELQQELPGEGEAIIAGVIFAVVGPALGQWLLWAVALAVLFMIYQSLSRIEKRLETLGKQ
jgi:hypothetical protein